MALPNPIGKQREVLALDNHGHFVVLGTAGSGKTTLAILRASMLSQRGCTADERVLLVTFNRALVTYLENLASQELVKVDVRNYHKFAVGYLGSRGAMGANVIIKNKKKLKLIEEAMDIVKGDVDHSVWDKPPQVFNEEINWIQRMGIKNQEDYMSAQRIGRGDTRIRRSERPFYFMVFQKYLELRSINGYKYDWEDLSDYVLGELGSDSGQRLYRHVVIDEGQDFSPTMLKSLVAAIPSNGSITFFGDVAQQIYGSRLSWRNAGLRPAQVWNFEENYRNTKEIADLGLAISKLPFYKDVPDMVQPRSPKASGPKPTLAKFKSETEELFSIAKVAIEQCKNQTVAILVHDRDHVTRITNTLNSLRYRGIQILHREMTTWSSSPGISVGTYHSAKGLEFDLVLMPFCNRDYLPSEKRILALDGIEEASIEEVKRVYVGVTRARQRLLISYSGQLSELLPTDESLYQKVER